MKLNEQRKALKSIRKFLKQREPMLGCNGYPYDVAFLVWALDHQLELRAVLKRVETEAIKKRSTPFASGMLWACDRIKTLSLNKRRRVS